jgi:hypothetical protein
MIIFITVLNNIAGEKENNLRRAMEMMGLTPSVYWTSQFISISWVVLVNALVTTTVGIAMGFKSFQNCFFPVSSNHVIYIIFPLM